MELSPFQKTAIQAIRDGHHVLVTAHTGSGKTLPAEFAIDHFVGLGKKVIYTSPIKALSNQKYADFSRKYPHITFGLLTGDIKTNPDAQVLIMTTEILMNALFRPIDDCCTTPLGFSIDIQRDLTCVIFDEIHYINDAERGHVWEKTILMLPRHIQMVMLSATIDNPGRFSQWIETIKGKTVTQASTLHRVVPLTHYSFVTVPESVLKKLDKATEQMVRATTQEVVPLLSAEGAFHELKYHKMHKIVKLVPKTARKFVLNQLLTFLRNRDMLPAIFFVFSRKQVEACAQEVTIPLLEDDSKVGYTMARECEQILRKLSNFHEYVQTAEYRLVVSLLEKGIGIHHSGMIPVLRELVELMISKKCIKVLFATESFAIGLDCPIKTAAFLSLTKFDGQHERLLYAHEYTQMAGRAGRRGIDTVGHVIHCNNLFFPTVGEYRVLLSGKPQSLSSKFHVSYNLVLSLLTNTPRLSLDECCLFTDLSMRRIDTDMALQKEHAKLATQKAEYQKLESTLFETLQCPLDVCQSYLAMEQALKTGINKKRKVIEREMALLVDQYRTCVPDAKRVDALNTMKKQVEATTEGVAELHQEMRQQMHHVCHTMLERGFLEQDGELKYHLSSPKGTMAAGLAEVHPLIMTDLLLAWSWFEDLHVGQIAAVLSCFTEVKVVVERREKPHCVDDKRVQQCALDVLARLGQDGNYDLLEWVLRWVDCHDEGQCRTLLQEVGVSTGDFTKAMLKISTIGKEVAAIAETHCQLECCQKLSLLDETILKYVATSQSLYV